MSNPTLDARMKAARLTLGFSQQDLADRMSLSSTSSISGWERDLVTPSAVKRKDLELFLFIPAREHNKPVRATIPTENESKEKPGWNLATLRAMELVKMTRKIEAVAGKVVLLNFLLTVKSNQMTLEDVIQMINDEEEK